ncbi:alpha beta hydrolase fold protein [Fusarium oxysporum f. sp. phaseoli]
MTQDTKHEALQPVHPSMKGKLDPVFEKLYNDNVANTPLKPIDLGILRSKYSVLYSYGTGPAPDVARQYDTQIVTHEGITLDVRVYEPDTAGPWPVHIDYHGGGWGLGDLDTESHICKHICNVAGVAVIDVAYRLVPENAFPCGVTDSFAALKYIYEKGAERFSIDPERISVGGVSAGGFISLALAHMARDAGIPLKLVAVGTPVIDDLSQYSSASDSPFKSMQENEHAPTLNWGRLAWFDKLKWSSLGSTPEDIAEKRAQIPAIYGNLFKADNFNNLAKTVIYTAGADPLRDEGEAYGMKLVEHGNEVTMKRFPGVPHPFMHMDKDLWQAKEFILQTAVIPAYDAPRLNSAARVPKAKIRRVQTGCLTCKRRNPAVAIAGDFASTVRGRQREQVDQGSTAGPMNHGSAQNNIADLLCQMSTAVPVDGADVDMTGTLPELSWDLTTDSGWLDILPETPPVAEDSPDSLPNTTLTLYTPSLVPDMTSPHDKALLNHYSNIVASVLSRHPNTTSNPYLSYLVPMAVSNQLILHCVLALSATHWQKLQPDMRDRALYHKGQATQSLAGLLPHVDGGSVDVALVSCLLLCMSELFDGTSAGWKLHLQGAKRLLSTVKSQTGGNLAGHFKFFVKLARFLDSAATTSTCKPPLIDDKTVTTTPEPTEDSSNDDAAVYGIPKELFHMVDRVNNLASKRGTRVDWIIGPMITVDSLALLHLCHQQMTTYSMQRLHTNGHSGSGFTKSQKDTL